MTLRGRVALLATLALVVSAVLPSAPAGAVTWLTQRCHSGSMRAEMTVEDGYRLRVVGRLDCGQRVRAATFAFARFTPELAPGMVDMNRLHPYSRTAPTRFDLSDVINSPGTHALCLMTSVRVRLSCYAFTAVGEVAPMRIRDIRRISPRDPLIRWRPIEAVTSALPVCATCI